MATKKEMQKKKNIAKKMIGQMESGGYEAWLHEQHSAYIENNLESYLDMNVSDGNESPGTSRESSNQSAANESPGTSNEPSDQR